MSKFYEHLFIIHVLMPILVHTHTIKKLSHAFFGHKLSTNAKKEWILIALHHSQFFSIIPFTSVNQHLLIFLYFLHFPTIETTPTDYQTAKESNNQFSYFFYFSVVPIYWRILKDWQFDQVNDGHGWADWASWWD